MSQNEQHFDGNSKPTDWDLYQQQMKQDPSIDKILRVLAATGAFVTVMGVSAGAGYCWLNGGQDWIRETAHRAWNEPIEVEFKNGETRSVWLDPDKTADAMRRTLSGG